MVKCGKKILIFICLIMFCTLLTSCNKEEELRLRIIANSNTVSDQNDKLIVKDAVEKILKENKELSVDILNKELYKYLDSTLYSKIKIELKDETYPAKSYKNEFIPSGIYKSIVITIGDGKGKNFWTMLYPEFFNISFEDDNEVEYHSYIYDTIKK